MSQRDSGYARIERDNYETPEWVTLALIPHLPTKWIKSVWEPAAGSGKMAVVLAKNFLTVWASDIAGEFAHYDFLTHSVSGFDAIITNPPYTLADLFIYRAITLMDETKGTVAMLLRCDFDSAAGRQIIFGASRIFAKKIILTKRIRWFEDSKGSPSFNHAWFIWDWKLQGPPTLAYAP